MLMASSTQWVAIKAQIKKRIKIIISGHTLSQSKKELSGRIQIFLTS